MINQIPYDILLFKIYPFLSLEDKFLTNKRDYIKYKTEILHSLKNQPIKPKKILSKAYMVNIIRNDYYFILNIILNHKFDSWYKPWKIRYKEAVLPCFIELLNYVCIEYKSTKCRNIIKERLKKKGIRKNKYKRIIIRKHKWNN